MGGTMRADGTIRPVLKVRAGYVPPEEQPKYVIPQKVRRATSNLTFFLNIQRTKEPGLPATGKLQAI